MGDKVLCREGYGSSRVKKNYVSTDDGRLVVVDQSPTGTTFSHFFRSVFLPQGYPESVSQDYLEYQIWDTIQAFASSITGTLAAQAVLKGVGVGDENATVLAATMTWILKDGTGMLGRIVFAWLRGSSLDCNSKRWRLFADILNDLAICIEILAPNFPGIFTPLVCTAGVCKSVVGVAGGATRAALTQHQARRNNMADVSAKDGSQETLVNLAALICNLALIPLVTGKQSLIWFLYIIFTCLHLYANYSAVKCVVMETMNQSRLNLIVKELLDCSHIPSIQHTNRLEPVVFRTRRKLEIILGCSVGKLCTSAKELQTLLMLYKGTPYLLGLNIKKGEICIALSDRATTSDQLQSCYQAEVINYVYENLYKNKTLHSSLAPVVKALENGDVHGALAASLIYTNLTIEAFCQGVVQQKWVLNPVLLNANEWRAKWDIDGVTDKKEY
ncbi:RUS family member 1-like [Ylistrum balloti]|uniref:RUS family member 1-like n=1 Tax=Ylistrum balloti TaxID=509963 RepID=UPI002905E09F|nr:RUS family member 1-like [Ylistrum balloti]